MGLFDISSVPGWGFRINLTLPPWSNLHHLPGVPLGHTINRCINVARPSSNPTKKLADFFSIWPSLHDYSRYEKKLGVTLFIFSETGLENCSFRRLLYVFQLQVQGFITPNRCSKKTVPRIYFKNHQNLPDSFLLETRKKKWGSPCSCCSRNKTVFFRH